MVERNFDRGLNEGMKNVKEIMKGKGLLGAFGPQ